CSARSSGVRKPIEVRVAAPTPSDGDGAPPGGGRCAIARSPATTTLAAPTTSTASAAASRGPDQRRELLERSIRDMGPPPWVTAKRAAREGSNADKLTRWP